jgi:hypothetical protein
MNEEITLSKDQITAIFKAWHTEFLNNPEEFNTTPNYGSEELAKSDAEYFINLYNELEKK